MKRIAFILAAMLLLLTACAITRPSQQLPTIAATIAIPTTPVPTMTKTATSTLMPTKTRVPPTPTPTLTPTPAYPPVGRGPTGFAPGVNPLTGIEVKDAALLNRRPMVIKVENLPRAHRPQWGLSLADIVYEYYTEQGATRFAAVYYGNDAERVGPIRSGRFFDSNIVEMYKAVFIYGSAYPPVQSRFYNSIFAGRLILETNRSCPALCRYDPNGENLLVADTTAMDEHLAMLGVDNQPQNLDGMFFKMQPPDGGEMAVQVFVRYSGAIYNRWDYDALTGRYLRFADKEDDVNRTNEVYEAQNDRLTGSPIAAQNVVTICVPHAYFVKNEEGEVLDILLTNTAGSYMSCDGQTYSGGSGPAYVARDGKMYKVTWSRPNRDSVLTLLNSDGTPFPFKPGQTWIEVIGASSGVESKIVGSWRFNHMMAP